jgi:hypothetical protein
MNQVIAQKYLRALGPWNMTIGLYSTGRCELGGEFFKAPLCLGGAIDTISGLTAHLSLNWP